MSTSHSLPRARGAPGRARQRVVQRHALWELHSAIRTRASRRAGPAPLLPSPRGSGVPARRAGRAGPAARGPVSSAQHWQARKICSRNNEWRAINMISWGAISADTHILVDLVVLDVVSGAARNDVHVHVLRGVGAEVTADGRPRQSGQRRVHPARQWRVHWRRSAAPTCAPHAAPAQTCRQPPPHSDPQTCPKYFLLNMR